MKILDHVVKSIRDAPFYTDPFHHSVVSEIFPADSYSLILNNLPELQEYGHGKHGDARISEYESTRRQIKLGSKLELMHPVFTDVYNTLSSKEVQTVVMEKLKDQLFSRFKTPIEEIECTPDITLVRDIGGYKIRPHPDTYDRSVTFQIYLPNDNSNIDCGTELYRETTRSDSAQPHRQKGILGTFNTIMQNVTGEKKKLNFELVKKMEFSPNLAYMFSVHQNSWHGVQAIAPNVVRDSIIIFYILSSAYSRKKY